MLSFWESRSLVHFDHIVIGGGFVGMHTALLLKEKFPSCKVAIIERGLLPFGASTKNAGFACVGSLTELLHDLGTMNEEDVLRLFSWRLEGLQKTISLFGKEAIGYREEGSHELLLEHHTSAIEHIDRVNELLLPISERPAFGIDQELIARQGMNTDYFKSAIVNHLEASIDTDALISRLFHACQQKGIQFFTGALVEDVSDDNKVTINSVQQKLKLTCDLLFYCTNAFTSTFFPELDIVPGRGLVLATHPINNLPLSGIYHFDEGYYYFRRVEDRIIFGGGRNIDKLAEQSTEFSINERIENDLLFKLQNYILPHHEFSIDQKWVGIMAFGESKMPIIKKVSDRQYMAVRCGGMGVAMAPITARELVLLTN